MKKLVISVLVFLLLATSLISAECFDSDGGKDYYVKGNITGIYEGVESFSEDYYRVGVTPGLPDLMEFYCINDTNYEGELYTCPYGGGDGACREEEPICTDSDGGLDYYTKGTVTFNTGSSTKGSQTDICDGDKLLECFCEERDYEHYTFFEVKHYTCPHGCRDGACLREGEEVGEETEQELVPRIESEPENCTDSDGGRNYYEKGTTIGSNMEVTDFCGIPQEYGEPIKVDSCEKMEGESGQQCTLYEGACGEAPEFDESHAISWLYDCPYGCEDGACIGEEVIINPDEEGKPINILEEEGVFYFCDGCKLFLPESEIKCYPYGYRKEGGYCFDGNNEFVKQKEAEVSCDNNFECESNVCVAGRCLSTNLLQKIINWFKRLFGIEPPKPPGPYMCPELLIEEDIGNCKYIQSMYDSDESQTPVYSRNGDLISMVTCCAVEYEGQDGQEQRAVVCPYNNRKNLKNSIGWFIKQEGFVPKEYKDQKVCLGGEEIIIWTHNKYLLAVGGDPPFSENITDDYLDKYASDFWDIELPEIKEGEARLPSRNTIVSDCGEIIDSDARDECYARRKALAECEKLTDINEREECYFEVWN